MRQLAQLWLPVLVVAACGFPRPPQLGDDAGNESGDANTPPGDAYIPPGISLRVAGTGDDNNDGVNQPIKTLKHALGLAATNNQITSIILASGRYSTAGGETFPYSIPADLTIIGPAGGGAILAGSNTELGLILGSGTLRDLEFEDFTVAITARGSAQITNIHIRTKSLGMRAEMSSDTTAGNLDIAGAVGACATGVELTGAAALHTDHLSTRSLAIAVNAQDQSTLTLLGADLGGDNSCTTASGTTRNGLIMLSTTKSLVLKDSVMSGGDNGIYFVGTGEPTQATIANTTIKGMRESGIAGGRYTLDFNGGEISLSSGGIAANIANVKLSGIVFKQLHGLAADLGSAGSFAMRDCSVETDLMYLNGAMAIDLGVSGSPGRNTFQQGGLTVENGVNETIYAVGNTWLRQTQGTDQDGHYASALIPGPVSGSNYSFSAGTSLQL